MRLHTSRCSPLQKRGLLYDPGMSKLRLGRWYPSACNLYSQGTLLSRCLCENSVAPYTTLCILTFPLDDARGVFGSTTRSLHESLTQFPQVHRFGCALPVAVTRQDSSTKYYTARSKSMYEQIVNTTEGLTGLIIDQSSGF